MFALFAFLCFLLAVLGVTPPFDLVALGLLFVSLHLLLGLWPLGPLPAWRTREPGVAP